MTSNPSQHTPRSQSSASEYDETRGDTRQDSVRSSRLGSFNNDEPTFDSQGSSETDSEVVPIGPSRLPVSVVWQNMTLISGGGLFKGPKATLLKGVSGYAEPRAVLAVVGPAKSGKSALVSAIGDRVLQSTKASGTLVYNGKSLRESRVRPTFFCATDEPLANVTVEQALIYTALLQMPDPGHGELEGEVRKVCERLGLLNDLFRSTNNLDLGTKRRLTVACQMICCSSLLVMHDTLLGIQEGDSLAILRAVDHLTKEGCTAIVVSQQPSTDMCSFFTNAYILVNGEVVFFGNTGTEAVSLLTNAGMPCPPIYSPVEQYMRLVDPSFEVYLQAHGGASSMGDNWHARFSGMMFKVLQGSYQNSPLAAESDQRARMLASASYDPIDDHKMRISSGRQWFILCRRLVTQGLQGLPLYLGRIIFCIIIALIYGGSYWKLNYSFLGAVERTTILFIAAAVLPTLAVATLPFYTNGVQVFVRENRRCQLGVATHVLALFTLTLPHLAAAAAFSAVAFIPMVDLNKSGAAWGYFIVNGTMAQMCADSMMLSVATVIPPFLQTPVALTLFLIQALASGFFPGSNRGFNLPVSVVSFIAWSYKGLVKNEFLYRTTEETWGCPGFGRVGPLTQGSCSLNAREVYEVVSDSEILLTRSRWIPLYILLGIFGFWTLVYAVALFLKTRTRRLSLGKNVTTQQLPVEHAAENPLYSNRSETREPANGHSRSLDSPV